MHPSNHPSKQATSQPSIDSPCSSDPPCTYLGATSFPRIFLGSVVRKTATRTPKVSPCRQPHYCVDWPCTAWGSQFSPHLIISSTKPIRFGVKHMKTQGHVRKWIHHGAEHSLIPNEHCMFHLLHTCTWHCAQDTS